MGDDSPGRSDDDRVRVTVLAGGDRHEFEADPGTTLREALLDAGHSPYTAVTGRLNCGGRGICATCGVRLLEGPPPEHWHDRLADRFGYPRLSCQVRLTDDVTVRIPEKLVWGGRESGGSGDREDASGEGTDPPG
ncbi:(2Fe-2S)-binding protein [Halobacteriales archaeon QS_8_69_26]|nr:MAG: (2Fe-2S)-binding protein [Halobacteriales archaeon QS_8_69_26]